MRCTYRLASCLYCIYETRWCRALICAALNCGCTKAPVWPTGVGVNCASVPAKKCGEKVAPKPMSRQRTTSASRTGRATRRLRRRGKPVGVTLTEAGPAGMTVGAVCSRCRANAVGCGADPLKPLLAGTLPDIRPLPLADIGAGDDADGWPGTGRLPLAERAGAASLYCEGLGRCGIVGRERGVEGSAPSSCIVIFAPDRNRYIF